MTNPDIRHISVVPMASGAASSGSLAARACQGALGALLAPALLAPALLAPAALSLLAIRGLSRRRAGAGFPGRLPNRFRL
jgi:hypothetical protein